MRLIPPGKFLYVANFASTSISEFDVSGTGELTPATTASASAGTSPDFFAFDPNGKYMYVANEGSNSFTEFLLNSDGTLTLKEYDSGRSGASFDRLHKIESKIMVRFGIAGFGLHAVKRLMPGFAKAKRCRVTALSRRSMATARDSAAEYKIPLGFDSVAAMAASPEVDAVLVTTPNASHLVDVLAAIDAGKHVLCEKPMAMNADECRQMVEAARRRGVVFGVAHVFRFDESVLRFRELLKSGKIGKAIFARSEFSFLADPSHPRKWLYDSAIAGAGPIFDIGVHCIDTLRFVLNDEVTRVSASAASDERSGDVESAARSPLSFPGGRSARCWFRTGQPTEHLLSWSETAA